MTEVRLLSVPLENDYKHTLYFASPEAQTSYFIGRTVFSETDFTYQRKEGYIRYPKHFDDLQGCNYIMYKNNPFSDKWYYAFITEMVYKGDETTWIYFETDVIQTYLFDYTVKPSFVEREHVDDDTPGKHTFPENLEVGEYVCEHKDQVTELANLAYIVGVTDVQMNADDENSWRTAWGTRYNGIFSGVQYYGFTESQYLNGMTYLYSKAGKIDSITSMFIYPSNLITIQEDKNYEILGSENPAEINKLFTPSSYYTGNYVPLNKKLYCFPYQYLLVTNNNGGSAIYHFEDFDERTELTENFKCNFKVKGCLTPGGSIRLVPLKYRNQDVNNEEGLNLGKFPICNWATDEYTNWLTQNSVNIGLNLATGAAQVIGGTAIGLATGGIGGVIAGGQVAGGISTIANQLAQIHQMSFTSSQSRGNINCGDVITADMTNTFYFQQMRIKDEYLQIIDNYFSMFGYKCNRVKTPLKNHRNNFWYTKTIDVNIDGNIPSKDMQTIKNCYNNGLTFWKNPSNIGNYSVDNSII